TRAMTVSDLILLPQVSEAEVVNELSSRYQANDIYTYIGPVLIAVNPYKLIKKNGKSLYDESLIEDFSGREIHENDPHPFAIAESAYSHMINFKANQCILITGESGSGKTETSKHVLQYIANISTKARTRLAVNQSRKLSDDKKHAIDKVVNNVRRILIRANPVLEAFGNAQTVRNNNSSRFGKYMLLQMNPSGQVVGGFVHNYLLEKNRVITQAAGERNFHCFYNLLAGASKADKAEWHLEDATKYAFLQHEQRTIHGVNDRTEFADLGHHMTAVGIADDDQRQIYQQLAAILHLGNVVFVSQVDGSHNPCCAIDVVCDLIEDAKMPGIFPLLDEQCAISQTSVDVLMHRFNETYVKEPHFIKSRVKGSVFSVRHYAGVVEYDLSHFAEANIDSFFTELYTELQKSSNAFVRNLLKDERSNKEKLKRPPSTSFQFRAQVNALVQDLNMCNPHYISSLPVFDCCCRCIKPNENKISGSINKQLVTAQVQCLGLVENIRVRRAGFCYRETYATFLHRYKILSRTSWPAVHNCSSLLTAEDVGVLPSLQPVSAQREAEANGQQRPLTPLEVYHMHLAAKNNKPTDGHEVPQPIIRFKEDIESLGCFSLGRNKVFIKHPAALFSLERLRQDKLPQIAKIIEDAWVRRL
ncbi:hypothetical protein DYB37_005455, partial [Aphanomyces astaci]